MKNHRIRHLGTLALVATLVGMHGVVSAVGSPKLEKLAPDLSSKSTQAGSASSIALDSSTDKTSATIKINGTWDPRPDLLFDLGLVAKTPFDSEKDSTRDLGDLTGLTAGTSIKIEAGVLQWPLVSLAGTKAIVDVCSSAIAEIFPDHFVSMTNPGDPKNLLNPDFNTDCPSMLEFSQLQAAVENGNTARAAAHKAAVEAAKAAKSPEPPAPTKMQLPISAEAILKQAKLKAAKLEDEVRPDSHGLTLSLAGNKQDFSFVTEAAPTVSQDQSKYGYGAELAYRFVGTNSVLSAGAGYHRSFKGSKERQICSPIGTTGSTVCSNAALKPPSEKKSGTGFVEYRTIYEKPFRLAISPRAEVDLESGDVGVRVPIYLVPNAERVLDAGVALGWTEEDKFGASIFVGKAFSFF